MLSPTGQRSVKELAEFNLPIHYNSEKQNVIADRFRRPSVNTYVECMEACKKLISSDQNKALLDTAESQHQQSDIWTVYMSPVMVEEQQKIQDILITPMKCFTVDNLKKTEIRKLNSRSEKHC